MVVKKILLVDVITQKEKIVPLKNYNFPTICLSICAYMCLYVCVGVGAGVCARANIKSVCECEGICVCMCV